MPDYAATIVVTADGATGKIQEVIRQIRGGLVEGLALGGDPNELYPVPGEDAFLSFEEGQEDPRVLEFAPARDLEEMAAALIVRHRDLLYPLANRTIRYLWKRQGGATNGAATLGVCRKTSGLLRYWSDCEFLIWLAADHTRRSHFSRMQIEALLFHELLHAEIDPESNKPTLRPHDYEGFIEELLRYGLWRPDLRAVGQAVRQLPLLEEDSDA